MSSVIEQLEQTELEATKARAEAWRELVIAVGDDTPVDPPHAKSVLESAGRSMSDLRAAVELYKRRKALAATIETAREKQANRLEIDREYAKSLKKLRAAEAEFHAVADPLARQIEDILESRRSASQAEAELRRTFADEFVISQSRSLDARRQRNAAKVTELTGLIERQRYIVGRNSTDSPLRNAGEAEREAIIARATQRISELEGELKEAQEAAAAMQLESDELDRLYLVP